jgi:hypothetical protein
MPSQRHIAYTIWNMTFIIGNYSYAVGRHTALLLAPFFLVWRHGWNTWLQARGYTLAFYFLLRCTFYRDLRAASDYAPRFLEHAILVETAKDGMQWLQVGSLVTVSILLMINSCIQAATYSRAF